VCFSLLNNSTTFATLKQYSSWMKNVLTALFLLISHVLLAQHYYNDIIGTKELSDKMKSYLAAGVHSVTATGYDPQGVKTNDFNEWQDVQGSVLKITSRNGQVVSRLYHQFDNNGRLISSRDSAKDIQIITTFAYDGNGNLVNVKMTTKDADTSQNFSETEERQWQYNAAGRPEKMWRIVNGHDSTEYRFVLDEYNNVAEEQLFRRGTATNSVYYYYDDKNRMSDIVRYNTKAKRLLPDVMFEYDEPGHVIQRITTVSTTSPDYFIWRYLYNDKGLKTKEALFNKFKELKGRIEYVYAF
jgi:YD repeat-containing protein